MESKSPAENLAECNRIGVDLWITDAKVALTFLDLAESTNIPEDPSRRIGEAYRAYQSILSFLARLNPTAEQNRILSDLVGTLETRLRTVGALVK